MKKVLNILLNIFKYIYIIVLVIYFIFIFIHRISVDNSIFGYRLFTINNSTMNPKYKVNDIVLIKDYPFDKLKVGDDISYYGNCCGLEGTVINHRIVKINKDNGKRVYITKGLNSPINDPEIENMDIIGKIVGKVFFINLLHHIFKNQIGFFLLVFCPILALIVVQIIKTIKDIKNDKTVKEKDNSKQEVLN